MSEIGQILSSVLPDRECHHTIRDIEIHPLLVTFAPSAIFAIERHFDFASLRVEALVKLEAHSFLPSIEEVVFGEGPKLDVALIGQINKLEFEVVPVVEGEGVGVDLLIET